MTPILELDRDRLERIYEADAIAYSKSLPLEHFMESIPQSTQREITLESLALVRAARPDVHVYSELLIQYVRPGEDPEKPRRVVPDNMVVVHPTPLKMHGSFMAILQPIGPLLVMEYVTPSNPRKDYEDNFLRYESDLKVPYYLLFQPDNRKLTLFKLQDEKYEQVHPNRAGRLVVPELELEAKVLKGWARFWFRGKLLPLPAELQRSLEAANERAAEAERLAAEANANAAEARANAATAIERAVEAERMAESEREERLAMTEELARLRAELAKRQSE